MLDREWRYKYSAMIIIIMLSFISHADVIVILLRKQSNVVKVARATL